MILRSLPFRLLSVLLIVAILLPLGVVLAEAKTLPASAVGSGLANLHPSSNSSSAELSNATFSGRGASGAPFTALPWILGMMALLGIALAMGVVQV